MDFNGENVSIREIVFKHGGWNYTAFIGAVTGDIAIIPHAVFVGAPRNGDPEFERALEFAKQVLEGLLVEYL